MLGKSVIHIIKIDEHYHYITIIFTYCIQKTTCLHHFWQVNHLYYLYQSIASSFYKWIMVNPIKSPVCPWFSWHVTVRTWAPRIAVRTSTAFQNRSWPGQRDLRRRKEFLGKKNSISNMYIIYILLYIWLYMYYIYIMYVYIIYRFYICIYVYIYIERERETATVHSIITQEHVGSS